MTQSEDEHERGALLTPSEDDSEAYLEKSDVKNLRRPNPQLQFRTAFFLALAVLASLAITLDGWLAWSRRFHRHTPSQVNTPSEQNPNNYILNPAWNFDAPTQEREFHWTIKDTVLNPDGVYRPMILINDQFPGPLIECNEGDTIVVHVSNEAVNATSIHWHGIYQNGTNWMDGTVGITQCPIAQGSKFTYRFTISGQSGSYWYHAHYAVQASDGLVGPLIVHSRDEKKLQKLDYASDRVIMVSDHYYDLSGELLMEYLQPGQENAEPVPGHALINGKGIRDCDSLPNRRCDNSTAEVPVINLSPNEQHRLRFINVGALAEFQVQLDEHEFAVTEVDGTDVQPAYYHRLKISPAQRYSIVVNTNVTSSSSFWLRARMVTTCFAEKNPEMEPEARAIVRYSTTDSPSEENTLSPQSKDWPEVVELMCRDMNTTELHPVEEVEAPSEADTVLYLRSNFEIGAWRLSRGFLNSSSWRSPFSSPSLHRTLDGISTENKTFSRQDTSTFINDQAFHTDRELVHQSSGIRTIDIVISNFDDGNHPFHLHGYKFFVLAQGHGYPSEDWASTVDLSNPLRRDTATVEAYGWIIIRFVADNPGMWAFHCHLSWHSEAGLLMQFLTRSDQMRDWFLPQANQELCERKGIERGKGPDDEIWFGNIG